MNLEHLVILESEEALKDYWANVLCTLEPMWNHSH